jgi:hypothetical protein
MSTPASESTQLEEHMQTPLPPRPPRTDSGLSLSPSRGMLTVILSDGALDLSDHVSAREALPSLPRESLEQIVLALRDRLVQDARAGGRRRPLASSTGPESRLSISGSLLSLGSDDGAERHSERLMDQIRRLQERIDELEDACAAKDDAIDQLTAQLQVPARPVAPARIW